MMISNNSYLIYSYVIYKNHLLVFTFFSFLDFYSLVCFNDSKDRARNVRIKFRATSISFLLISAYLHPFLIYIY